MSGRFAWCLLFVAPAWGQSVSKVPSGVILVKGASPSASDSVTPEPESAAIADGVFRDLYFGIEYTLPAHWAEKYQGPPPSESGRYVLAQIGPADALPETARGSILITAQDLFFGPPPGDDVGGAYQIETPRTRITVAERPFTFFAYGSPAAQLHWYVLATEIRCHAVEFVLTGRDTALLARLVSDMKRTMKLPDGGGIPVCIQDYARGDGNVLARVNPAFSKRRFHVVPVRIVIDPEGNVKHIHILSAFPDQARAITDALRQWRFKPYWRDGKPVEVETGILFGR